MSIKIIIKTEDSIIRKSYNNGNSARVTLPKEWDGKEVYCIPLPHTLEDKVHDLFSQERIIINNSEVIEKTATSRPGVKVGVYVPKRYCDDYVIVSLKN